MHLRGCMSICQKIWDWLCVRACVCIFCSFVGAYCRCVFLCECMLFVHVCVFLSSHSRLIRKNAVGEAPLCVWSHHSDCRRCFPSQIKQHLPSHVCLPNMNQGWWSYVHYQTARPHLPCDTFSLSHSCSLSLLLSCLALFLQAAADWLSATDWVILSQSVISPSSPQISPLLLLSSIKARLPEREGETLKGVKTVAN